MYNYKDNILKSKEDLMNCLGVGDAPQDLYNRWMDRGDDFRFWLEQILEERINDKLNKKNPNELQCSEFWKLILNVNDGDDMPAWLQELNVIDSKLSSNEVPVYKPKSAKKNGESKKVTAKKRIKAESIKKISSAQKDTKSVKTKTSAKSKRQVVSQNVSTSRYTLFSGKNAYFGESVCELEKLSDGCFRSKQKVSDSNEELRTLLRSGEFFVTDWQGGYFKCGEFKKDDSNKLIVRCGKTSGIGFASKVEGTKSGRKTQQGQKIKRNEEGIKCSVVPPRKESFLEKLKNGILDFCEVYNQYNDPGDVYVP